MTAKQRVKIRRATKVNGRLARVGEEIEVDTVTCNTLVHFGKARLMGPVADERETELKTKLIKRAVKAKPAQDAIDVEKPAEPAEDDDQ